jgi:hypothetical protein
MQTADDKQRAVDDVFRQRTAGTNWCYPAAAQQQHVWWRVCWAAAERATQTTSRWRRVPAAGDVRSWRRWRAPGGVYGRRSVVLARVYGRVRGDGDGWFYVLVIDDLRQQLEWRAC